MWRSIFFQLTLKKKLNWWKKRVEDLGARFARSEVWEKGGEGGKELAKAVFEAAEKEKSDFTLLYDEKKSIVEKIETIAKEIYGAGTSQIFPEGQKTNGDARTRKTGQNANLHCQNAIFSFG